jgi:glycosyltransferase involved in cell wall biosynthesis
MINNKLSLVVPVFNEEKAVPLFIEAVIPIMVQVSAAFNLGYEIIFVNDGSKDNTLIVIKEAQKRNSNIRFISFSRNFGKEAAIYAGLKKSIGGYICILDVDLQDPPSLIPDMLSVVVGGERDGNIDCTAARRVSRTGEPVIRSFFARQFYKIMYKLTDIEIIDGARDFRLMSRKVADAVLSLNEYNRFSKGIFPWVGFKTKWFEYENIKRSAGETKWSFWKLFVYAIDGIIAFSTKPLVIASLAGFFFFFLAVLLIIFIIIRKILYGDPVAGWPSLACIILFSSGIQLITVGILGQYLAKTYLEVKKRPIFLIEEES